MGNIIQQKPWFGTLRKDPHWSTKGLAGIWPFRKAGKLIDYTSNKNDGVITGTWVGDSLSFDGVGDGVVFNQSDTLGINGTIVIRARINALTAARTLLQEETSGFIDWDILGSTLRIRIFDTNFTTFANVIIDTDWHTIALAWSTNGVSVCVDGVLFASDPTFTGLNAGAVNGITLASSRTQDEFMDCNISDLDIYDRALSVREILDLYINPNLPFQRQPLWLGKAPVAPTGVQAGIYYRTLLQGVS